MRHTRFTTILLAILALGTGIVAFIAPVSSVAHADTITIIPPRFELFGNPGDTVVEKMRVINDSATDIDYTTAIQDFTANGDEGGVSLLNDNSPTAAYALAKWMSVEPSSFSIPAGADRTLDISIRIPQNAEPGGHFASVLVHRAGTPTQGGAAVDTQVGSLFLLRVSGDIVEAAKVDTFKAEETFSQFGPVVLALRTINSGNVHVAPTGTITITNMFGHKVAEIPLVNANVLPGAARIVRTTWNQKNLVGRYTATLVATYGEANTTGGPPKTLTATTSFIVVPFYLIGIIVGIIVLALLLVTQRKQLKKMINRLTAD